MNSPWLQPCTVRKSTLHLVLLKAPHTENGTTLWDSLYVHRQSCLHTLALHKYTTSQCHSKAGPIETAPSFINKVVCFEPLPEQFPLTLPFSFLVVCRESLGWSTDVGCETFGGGFDCKTCTWILSLCSMFWTVTSTHSPQSSSYFWKIIRASLSRLKQSLTFTATSSFWWRSRTLRLSSYWNKTCRKSKKRTAHDLTFPHHYPCIPFEFQWKLNVNNTSKQ